MAVLGQSAIREVVVMRGTKKENPFTRSRLASGHCLDGQCTIRLGYV